MSPHRSPIAAPAAYFDSPLPLPAAEDRHTGFGSDNPWYLLADLPIDWALIALPNFGEFDRLLVGPGGVFVVAMHHHPGARVWMSDDILLVNGRRTTDLYNGRFAADMATELLSATIVNSVKVRALIVMVGPAISQRFDDGDVAVIEWFNVAEWLDGRAESVEPEMVDMIIDQARVSATWSLAALGKPSPAM
jgi:hypothetical protein